MGKELCYIRSQIENAVRSNANHEEMTVSVRHTGDTKKVVHTTAVESDAIEVGNEVYAPTIRPFPKSFGPPSILRLQTSRLDTEMREIRPHSIVQ